MVTTRSSPTSEWYRHIGAIATFTTCLPRVRACSQRRTYRGSGPPPTSVTHQWRRPSPGRLRHLRAPDRHDLAMITQRRTRRPQGPALLAPDMRKRLVKLSTRRFRGNVMDVTAGGIAIQANGRYWTCVIARMRAWTFVSAVLPGVDTQVAARQHARHEPRFAIWPATRWAAPRACTRSGTVRRRTGTQPPRPPRDPAIHLRGSDRCSRHTCLPPARTGWPPGRPAP